MDSILSYAYYIISVDSKLVRVQIKKVHGRKICPININVGTFEVLAHCVFVFNNPDSWNKQKQLSTECLTLTVSA